MLLYGVSSSEESLQPPPVREGGKTEKEFTERVVETELISCDFRTERSPSDHDGVEASLSRYPRAYMDIGGKAAGVLCRGKGSCQAESPAGCCVRPRISFSRDFPDAVPKAKSPEVQDYVRDNRMPFKRLQEAP